MPFYRKNWKLPIWTKINVWTRYRKSFKVISSSLFSLIQWNARLMKKIRNKMTLIRHHQGLIYTRTFSSSCSIRVFARYFGKIDWKNDIIYPSKSVCLYFNIVIKIDFITLIWISIFLWHLFFKHTSSLCLHAVLPPCINSNFINSYSIHLYFACEETRLTTQSKRGNLSFLMCEI